MNHFLKSHFFLIFYKSHLFCLKVLKPLDKKFAANAAANGGSPPNEGEVLNGRVKYRGADRSEEEVQFGEKDQVG